MRRNDYIMCLLVRSSTSSVNSGPIVVLVGMEWNAVWNGICYVVQSENAIANEVRYEYSRHANSATVVVLVVVY